MIITTRRTNLGTADFGDAVLDHIELHSTPSLEEMSQKNSVATYKISGTPKQLSIAEARAAALGTHVPQSVRSEQFWLALLNADEPLFDEAEALIEQSKAYRVARWQAATISRDSKTLKAIQQALGVSDGFLDRLFQAAVQVET